MMSREQFDEFLKEIGGLIYTRPLRPVVPIYSFAGSCDEGWFELIADLIQELIDAGWTREVRQIKEKFGGLRFYADGLPDNGAEIIRKYEALSLKTCEFCGSKEDVRLRGHRWVKTLCEECARPWLEISYSTRLKCVYKRPD